MGILWLINMNIRNTIDMEPIGNPILMKLREVPNKLYIKISRRASTSSANLLAFVPPKRLKRALFPFPSLSTLQVKFLFFAGRQEFFNRQAR